MCLSYVVDNRNALRLPKQKAMPKPYQREKPSARDNTLEKDWRGSVAP